MDLHDVRMLQASDGLGLEASQFRRAGVTTGPDHLQGHRPLQGQVPRLIDDTHAAAAQFSQDFVTGNRDSCS